MNNASQPLPIYLPLDSGLLLQLRQHGLRPTTARSSVLQVMQESADTALAAERVFERVDKMGVQCSLGTVYRVLHELDQCGLVQRELHAGDQAGKSRYVLAPSILPPAEYAFVCQDCRRQSVVKDKHFADLLYRYAKALGFELSLSALVVPITCNDCLGKV